MFFPDARRQFADSKIEQMSIRDPDFRHNYAATGVDPGIISNRIGNIFNLKGPR